MNLDYKEKYLKYKSKYLLAKAQQGGTLTPAQKESIKQDIINFFFKLTIEDLKKLEARVISHITSESIRKFDDVTNNSHIIEKTLLLYMFLIGNTPINDNNKLNFLNVMIEHILNPQINEKQFYSLLQTYTQEEINLANILITNFKILEQKIPQVDDLIFTLINTYKYTIDDLFRKKLQVLYTYYLKTTYPLPSLFYTNIISFIYQIVKDLMSSEVNLQLFEKRTLEIK